jgi:quercetin dioxygenase-like cupin family protein
MRVAEIFCIDQHDVPWVDYERSPGAGNGIRVKALTASVDTSTRVQYIEYPPDHADPVHRHDEGEVFIVTDGELWLDNARYRSGSILCIPPDVDYAVRSGPHGARYFRVVIPS